MSVTPMNTVRALQAHAGLCVGAFARHHGVSHEAIDAIVDHLVVVLCDVSLAAWERDGAALAICGRGDPVPQAVTELFAPDATLDFDRLVQEATEVALSVLYGAFTKSPLGHWQRCLDILSRHDVSIPPKTGLPTSIVWCWGEPISDAEYAAFRDAHGLIS